MKTTSYNPSEFIEQLEREAKRKGITRRVERRFVPRIGTVIVAFDIGNDYDSADLSYLGEFGSSPKEYAIDTHKACIIVGDQEIKSCAAEYHGKQHIKNRYFYAYNTDGLRDAELIKAVEENYERYENFGNSWEFACLDVTVYFKGFEVARDSVCGIETDSSQEYFDGWFKELYDNCDIASGIARTKADLEAKLALLTSSEGN